jgi:DNA-cytosine methyltransferase
MYLEMKNTTQNKRELKVMDLFSGAGGFSIGLDTPTKLNELGNLDYTGLGFDTISFETVVAVEKNEEAAKTFEKNFPTAEVYIEDVSNIDSFTKWADIVDVIVGGPPCQGFSTANKTKTENLDDDRNSLWKEFMRAVEDVNPEFFIIENVERFVSTGHAEEVSDYAKSLGYEVSVNILDGDDFGVPQMRTRAFIIGSKNGKIDIPDSNDEAVRTVSDAISDLEDNPEESDVKWHNSRNSHEITHKRMEKLPIPGGDRRDLNDYPELLPDCWKNLDDGSFTDAFGRLWEDRPASTITTGFYQPMKGRFIHPYENRVMTVREGARFQTFPDSYEFASTAKSTVANQIGNAVPPKLAYELGKLIENHIEKQH